MKAYLKFTSTAPNNTHQHPEVVTMAEFSVSDFIYGSNIDVTVSPTNEDFTLWEETPTYKYVVCIQNNKTKDSMHVLYGQNTKRPIEAPHVVSCVLQDVMTMKDKTVTEFIDEFDGNRLLYKACQRQAKKLEKVVGGEWMALIPQINLDQ
jgi:hypothetical protein